MADGASWDVTGFTRGRTDKAVPFWCDRCARTKTAKSRYTGVVDDTRKVICNACYGELRAPADV